MVKKFLIVFFLASSFIFSYEYVEDFEIYNRGGGVSSITTDQYFNVYTVENDNHVTEVTGIYYQRTLIRKFSNNGRLLWVKDLTFDENPETITRLSSRIYGTKISIDKKGNLYVLRNGYYFPESNPNNIVFTSNLSLLDSRKGDLVWSNIVTNAELDYIYFDTMDVTLLNRVLMSDMIIDFQDDVYVLYGYNYYLNNTSYITSSIRKYNSNKETLTIFKQDGIQATKIGLKEFVYDSEIFISGGGDDGYVYNDDIPIFVYKLIKNENNTYSYSWKNNNLIEKSEYVYLSGLVVDTGGNFIIAGTTTKEIYGAPISKSSIIVSKYDPNGLLLWGKQIFDEIKYYQCAAISYDSLGNIIIAGEVLYNFYYLSDIQDNLILQFNKDGELGWSKEYGYESLNYLNSIAVNSLGNIYVGGGSGLVDMGHYLYGYSYIGKFIPQ